VFDQSHDPRSHFAGVEDATERNLEEVMSLQAYKEPKFSEDDGGCGMAELAGQSVAVPFVSSFVATLVAAQAIRLASNQTPYFSIAGDLNVLRSIRTVLGASAGRTVVGYTEMTQPGRRTRPNRTP
jgi:hypothetical protein